MPRTVRQGVGIEAGRQAASVRGGVVAIEPRIQYAQTTDGVSIAFWTMGEGAPLVCLPPYGWSHLQLEWQEPQTRTWYERLARTRRLVRFDVRGMGLSTRNVDDFSLEAILRDLEAVADHLELEKFALYGTGPNAPLAITYAARHPERVAHLILFNPQLIVFETGGAGAALLQVAKADWKTFTEAIAQASLGWSEGDSARWFASFIRQSVEQDTWLQMLKDYVEIDATPFLPEVSAPTLVLAHSGQRGFDASRVSDFASQMQNARVAFLKEIRSELKEIGSEQLSAIDEFLSAGQETEPKTELPEGMAVILFADIVESTALTEELGDTAFREKARELDKSLRAIIGEAGGTPVEGKVLGDGVLAVFTSARQAIDCALRCNGAGESVGLQLHLGIHAGDVIREGNNVYGGAVNIAARIATASAPGEVLVSDTVRGLARTSAGVTFDDRGEHELKGIEEPQRLFVVRGGADG